MPLTGALALTLWTASAEGLLRLLQPWGKRILVRRSVSGLRCLYTERNQSGRRPHKENTHEERRTVLIRY